MEEFKTKEEINLESFCIWDWIQKETAIMLDEALRKAIECEEASKNDT